jgi:hypothetical protein
MTIDEAIERYTSNAEYERTHGNLQGCLEFRQLTEWLKDYKRLKEQEPTGHWIRITNGGAVKEMYMCSVCHRRIEDDGIEALITIKYPYCHCGAKMIERSDKE